MNENQQKILVMYSTDHATDGHIGRMKTICGDRSVLVIGSESEAIESAPDAEIILGHRYLWQSLPHAGKLQWVQSSASGIDHLRVPELQVSRPILTRAPLFSSEIAWHALSMGLALSRRVIAPGLSQDKEQWKGDNLPSLPKSAMVFGAGCVGSVLGQYLKGLGLRVIGVNREGGDPVAPWDLLISRGENWKDYLEEVDFFFFCAPYNLTTHHIFDEECLGRLPDSAIIVSISNSRVFDFSALVSEVKTKRISVALDHLDDSHYTDEYLLEKLRNLIITPKVSSYCPDRQERFESFVEEQIQRYVSNRPLLYEVVY